MLGGVEGEARMSGEGLITLSNSSSYEGLSTVNKPDLFLQAVTAALMKMIAVILEG